MDDFKSSSRDYLKVLNKRSKESKVYKSFQMTGLTLAELLDDNEHKSLYIRLSKIYDNHRLLQLAKSLAERKNIDNKGAYFMRMLKIDDVPKLVEGIKRQATSDGK